MEFDTPPLFHIERKGFENTIKSAGAYPRLKPPMTGLIRRVFPGQILPMRTGLEHPQDAFEDAAVVLAGTTTSLQTMNWCDKRRDDFPLQVGDEHEERD